MHARKRFSVVAAVVRTKHVAGLLVHYAPRRNVNVFGILRINDDVIENIVIAAQVGQARPIVSSVRGQEERSRAGAEVDTVGILRVET